MRYLKHLSLASVSFAVICFVPLSNLSLDEIAQTVDSKQDPKKVEADRLLEDCRNN